MDSNFSTTFSKEDKGVLALSITIRTPRKLIDKHPELFVLSIGLFLVGFMIGLQPEYGQPIIEKAREIEINQYDTLANIRAIFVNNGMISVVTWVGWFLAPILGIQYFPPIIMVYNIGAAYGAVAGYVSLPQFLLTIASFGIMEAIGLIFGMVAGLLFPKYIFMKLTGKSVEFSDYASDALALMFYSAVALFAGALFEALLINPTIMVVGIAGGLVATFFFLKVIFEKA